MLRGKVSKLTTTILSRGALRTAVAISQRTVRVQSTNIMRNFSSYGDSVTYSGGQAISGQGGYYGSGGSRRTLDPTTEQKVGMVAMAGDVEMVAATMTELESLEAILRDEENHSGGGDDAPPSPQTILVRSKIKKLMTEQEFGRALKNLEVEGQPVWGLNREERELVAMARAKVNEC